MMGALCAAHAHLRNWDLVLFGGRVFVRHPSGDMHLDPAQLVDLVAELGVGVPVRLEGFRIRLGWKWEGTN